MKKTSYILSLVSILNMSAETVGGKGDTSLLDIDIAEDAHTYRYLCEELKSKFINQFSDIVDKNSPMQQDEKLKGFVMYGISSNGYAINDQVFYIGNTINECRFEELKSEHQEKDGKVVVAPGQKIDSVKHDLFMPNSFKSALVDIANAINTGGDLGKALQDFRNTEPDTLVLNGAAPDDMDKLNDAANILDPNYSYAGSPTIAEVVDIMKRYSYRDNSMPMNLYHISQALPLQLTENDYILDISELYKDVLNLDNAINNATGAVDPRVTSVLASLGAVNSNTVPPLDKTKFSKQEETALLEWFINSIMNNGYSV